MYPDGFSPAVQLVLPPVTLCISPVPKFASERLTKLSFLGRALWPTSSSKSFDAPANGYALECFHRQISPPLSLPTDSAHALRLRYTDRFLDSLEGYLSSWVSYPLFNQISPYSWFHSQVPGEKRGSRLPHLLVPPENFVGLNPSKALGEIAFNTPKPHSNFVLNIFALQELTSALPMAYYMAARRGLDSPMDARLLPSATLSSQMTRSATHGLMAWNSRKHIKSSVQLRMLPAASGVP